MISKNCVFRIPIETPIPIRWIDDYEVLTKPKPINYIEFPYPRELYGNEQKILEYVKEKYRICIQ